MHLKDLLAFRDFIGDVKGIITRRAWEGVTNTSTISETSVIESEAKHPSPHRIVNRSPSHNPSRQVELIESVLDDILDESSHETHNLV